MADIDTPIIDFHCHSGRWGRPHIDDDIGRRAAQKETAKMANHNTTSRKESFVAILSTPPCTRPRFSPLSRACVSVHRSFALTASLPV